MTDRFTIRDIHDIRYENHEKTKNMSHEQLLEHTHREAAEGLEILKKMRSAQKPVSSQ